MYPHEDYQVYLLVNMATGLRGDLSPKVSQGLMDSSWFRCQQDLKDGEFKQKFVYKQCSGV